MLDTFDKRRLSRIASESMDLTDFKIKAREDEFVQSYMNNVKAEEKDFMIMDNALADIYEEAIKGMR